ncbi:MULTISPECIES: MFS transporter [Klebsiella]|uniref:MFS transporter n=1 Tax=Klebsiella TaxID=570 RepID=UPI00027C4ABE|nr:MULTISPECIES: MFS transporter [unclassified Klebsiella]EJU35703.1 transporter, major facilitator family protein [Klebsiella sp. OBRC7]MDU7821568.1 MFS transporter [Klebsiella sp.]HDH0672145.1 MFS transporter [Klebsiella michiganensis]HDS5558024.1 MFS transporter [Klebsiella michiganensis]
MIINQTVHEHPLLKSAFFALTGLTVVGQIYLPIPILAEINQHFNSGESAAGWVSSAFSIGYSAGFLLSGPLSDRFGRRRIMLLGFVFFIISTILVSISSHFNELLIFRIIQGLTASTYPPIILAYLNEHLLPPWRGRAISFMSLGFLTASIIAQLYAISLSAHGLNFIEFTFIPLYCISLILLFFYIEDIDRNNKTESLIEIYKKIPVLLFDKNLKWLYVSTLCTLSALVSFYILLDENYGHRFSAAHIDLLMTRLIALPVMFLSLLAPQLIYKIGAIFVVRWSFFIASAGLLLSSIAVFFGSTWGLLFSSIIFIGGRAFSVPSLVGTIGSIAEKKLKGTAISLYTFILFIGASLGPFIAHLLMHFDYFVSLIMLAFIAGVPALLTFHMNKNVLSITQSS